MKVLKKQRVVQMKQIEHTNDKKNVKISSTSIYNSNVGTFQDCHNL